jgi:hypothetical protein
MAMKLHGLQMGDMNGCEVKGSTVAWCKDNITLNDFDYVRNNRLRH